MKEVLRLVPPGAPLAVLLDYDGTLVPIRKRPDLARLHPKRRCLLARLGRSSLVGLISGRPLDELRRLVGLPGVAYVGNHGMEIRLGGTDWVHPAAAKLAPEVDRAADAIRAAAGGLRGVIVENKGLTASVHYRLCNPGERERLRAAVAGVVRRSRGDLVLTRGKMVFELRPNIPWDKGRGVLKLLRLAGGPKSLLPIYIGDDRTDEDAFLALAGRGLTIRVGPGRRTLARYSFRGVEEVWEFLAALDRTLSRPSPSS